jgi:Rap guanine nucleotide exchange factor 2
MNNDVNNDIQFCYLAFKEMLQMPDNSPRPRSRPNKPEMLPRLQTDPRIRLSTHVDPLTPVNPLNPMVGGVPLLIPADTSNVSPCKDAKKEHKGFMTLGPRKRFQKALMKMNILPKNMIK